jgi:6-phosphogluconate dehydrogenase
MQIGFVGLGKMGGNMCRRLVKGGHQVIATDPDDGARASAAAFGITVKDTVAELVGALDTPRVIWLMVPAGAPTKESIQVVSDALTSGDILIDGGNSHYKEAMQRAVALGKLGIAFLDVGTSGGVWGRENGYCLMVGGDKTAVERAAPLFSTLAPSQTEGWRHLGPSGAGHFVKMIHNGIEYGMMQAVAEGFTLLDKKRDFNLDLAKIAALWGHGSVVRSWLLELTAAALSENPGLDGIAPFVPDSGEGRWTVAEAIEQDVSAPVITLSLMERFRSREQGRFADKLLAALRDQFGGHGVKAT